MPAQLRFRPSLLVCLVLLTARLTWADIAAIHPDALPQDSSTIDALHDAAAMEPYSRYWTSPWKYPLPQKEVAAHLSKDLHALLAALKKNPGNQDLLLLTGLVATYAYNLDVKGSDQAALATLDDARKRFPNDIRASWFHAAFVCGTDQPKVGAEEFLGIESTRPPDLLPFGFWDDYLECASVTMMPAHALRAADHLAKMNAPANQLRSTLIEINRNRFIPFDPIKEYKSDLVWSATSLGDAMEFTSIACGVRFRVPRTWAVERMDFANGSCVAQFRTGTYTAGSHDWSPNVLLLVQRPVGGESLEAWSQRFLTNGTFTPFHPSRCPADQCIAMKGVQPSMYPEGGGGRGRIVFFQRDQPPFPGLSFETPVEPPRSGGSAAVQYYRPAKLLQRISGKLDYLVLLDTAAAIEDPAAKDYEFFLENLSVE